MRNLASLLFCLAALTTGIARGQEVADRGLLFAFFAQGGLFGGADRTDHFVTEFTLSNPGQKAAQVAFQFFAKDGSVVPFDLARFGSLVPNPFVLEAQASTTVTVLFQRRLHIGWVKIESSEPVTAQQTLTRRIFFEGSPPELTPPLVAVGMRPSVPTREFTIAAVDDFEWGSGISIAVPDSTRNVQGTLTLIDRTGSVVSNRQVSVSGDAQLVLTATELFPQLTTLLQGTIVGNFDSDIIVASLRYGKLLPHPYAINIVSKQVLP